MIVVAKKISFDAAHWLPNYEGKCHQMHGHHWVVELAVKGLTGKDSGMVIDFTYLKEFLKTIEDTFDHKVVNDVIENPTAENICHYVLRKFLDWQNTHHEKFIGVKFSWVRIWETEDSYALLSS